MVAITLTTPMMMMPASTLMPGLTAAIASPPNTRFAAKNPTYMTTTMTTINRAPKEPNWPRVWIICATPSCGPWAECSAMKMPPTTLPMMMPTIAGTKPRPNTVVASPPVTMVMIMMLEPNQMVKRSLALPWRSLAGMGWMVLSSSRGTSVVGAVLMTHSGMPRQVHGRLWRLLCCGSPSGPADRTPGWRLRRW